MRSGADRVDDAGGVPDTDRLEAYDYELPAELIAPRPAARRDASRLLVVDRFMGSFADAAFPDLLDFIRPGDAVVVNDSRVFPARFLGRKPTGASAEILLLHPEPLGDRASVAGGDRASAAGGDRASVAGGDELSGPADPFDRADPRIWRAMVRPGGKLKPGRTVEVADGLTIEVIDSSPDGTRIVELIGDGDPWELIERHGRTPLPPYIARADNQADRERYQTVYAAATGSVAAPTAGLHFTGDLLARIEERGARIVRLTLHVGFGTFRPVTADSLSEHDLGAESYRLSSAAARRLNETRKGDGRIVAVGTTSCRVLESVSASGRFEAGCGWTNLFIRPPYRFRAVDALLTNFHLPRSTLLVLVAAFAGRELALRAYAHAIGSRYRFYSYGDAMLIA